MPYPGGVNFKLRRTDYQNLADEPINAEINVHSSKIQSQPPPALWQIMELQRAKTQVIKVSLCRAQPCSEAHQESTHHK